MTERILGPGSPTDQLIRRLKKQNKDKEWSLKEKENFIPDAGAHSREHFDENCYYYNKKDIDTLREKLIEDMKNIRIPIKGLDDKDVPMQEFICHLYELYDKEVIKIINKRFGVEEK